MMFLIKLRRTLQYNKICNNLYLVVIGIILLLLTIFRFNYLYLVLTIIYFILLIIINKSILIILIIISILMSVNIIIRNINYNKVSYGNITLKADIINIEKKDSNYKVTIKGNNLKYICYIEEKLSIGDEIVVSGNLYKGDKNHSDHLFDYGLYLKENNIKGLIEVDSIRIIKNKFTIFKLYDICDKYYSNSYKKESSGYLKALLIGNKNDLDRPLQDSISMIGVGHLFVISGLHMNILSMIVSKILKTIRIKEKYHFYIITPFFALYFILTCGMISILRVLLVYVLSHINKNKNFNLSTLDIYMLSILIILLINPYYITNYAFVLTYLISSSLVFINPLIRRKGFIGNLINNILISINSILITLPVIININPTLNLLSIIYNLIYIPFVSYILLPLSIIVTILPFTGFIYEFIVSNFSIITKILSRINICKITFNTVSLIIPIIYYLLYLVLIKSLISKNKKIIKITLVVFVSFLFCWNNIIIINDYDEVIFLDLPEGEATLIKKAYNKANILIDTGENSGDDLELYLKKRGIKRLDYIFITHSDSDHNGKLGMLVNNFKVKNVVINKYDKISKKILEENKYKNNLYMVKRKDKFKIKDIYIEILLPDKDTNDSNNNSLVIYMKAFNSTFLFTGDIEEKQEELLYYLEKEIKVDFLKIPHHGSITSSSKYLLNCVKYDYAICMSGYKNTFGFPNNFVISRYNKEKLYLTKEKNTIIFKKHWYNKILKCS